MVLGIDASQANRAKRTGTEWYAFYIIEEFKKLLADKEITVRLYLDGSPREDIVHGLPKNFEIRRLRWFLPRFWVQGRLSLEMLWHSPDMLFCPAHAIPLISPKLTYTTIHDVGFRAYPRAYSGFSLWYLNFAANLAIKRAKKIFTISKFSKNEIIKYYPSAAGKLTVTYLGFDNERYRLHGAGLVAGKLTRWNLAYKNYLLFLGRIEPKKNILNLVKAYEILSPDHNINIPQLVLAGRESDSTAVREYLKDRPDLDKKVKFLGYVAEEDKAALYNGASAFVFPTLYEGFGLPIIEAQACGTPVIYSNSTGGAEISGKAGIGVDPSDPRSIASGIKAVLTDKTKIDEMVKLGLQNTKRFTWQETAQLTYESMFSKEV